jgi:hypothetical protein
MKNLSPKALGLLVHINRYGAINGAEGLAEAFGTGVKSVRTGLTELRSNGLISLSKGRTGNGHYWSEVLITEAGQAVVERYAEMAHGRSAKKATRRSAKTGNYISPNSHSANTPYSKRANSILKEGRTESDEKEEFDKVPMPIGEQMQRDPDDEAEAKKKWEEETRVKRREAKESRRVEKIKHIASRPVEDWTPTQLAEYFADHMKQMNWKIAEWTSRSGFKGGIENLRMNHNTNGVIEKELIDRFFSTIKHDKGLDNPDLIWRMFIKRAPQMLNDAKASLRTDKDVVALREQASKSWEGLDV